MVFDWKLTFDIKERYGWNKFKGKLIKWPRLTVDIKLIFHVIGIYKDGHFTAGTTPFVMDFWLFQREWSVGSDYQILWWLTQLLENIMIESQSHDQREEHGQWRDHLNSREQTEDWSWAV